MCQNMSGLSTAEVEFRKKAGLSNESVDSSTKTVAQIIRSNVVTYYNLIFLIITILLIVVGSFRDLTFLPIIIAARRYSPAARARHARPEARLRRFPEKSWMILRY